MIGGLWNGLSGLNTYEKALGVESNNITNVNTIGHKADDIRFEDLLYQNGYGKGSTIQSVDKRIIQGGLQVTGNSFDVAIEGKGYFIVQENNDTDVAYTRAGNFKMGTDGILQTPDSLSVLGLTPQTISIISSNENEKVFTNDYNKFIASQIVSNDNLIKTINTKSTNYLDSARDSGISGSGYKSSDSKISDIDALMLDYKSKLKDYSLSSTSPSTTSSSQMSTINYSNLTSDLIDENDYISVLIDKVKISQKFDTNVETTLNKFSDKLSNIKGITSSVNTSGIVDITSLIPGKEIAITEASINGNYTQIENIQDARLGSGQGLVDSSRNALKTALESADAKLIEITSNISLSNEKNLTVNKIQMKLDNLNLVENSFGSVIIEKGNIYLKDGDNSFLVGKLETAMFRNEQGLNALGNNLYKNTDESGKALFAGDMNKLVSNTLELSNANLGTSLTSLLVYQKAFEANSKSITTSDEMLSTAMDLVK
jgi:flagellar hook protein FlgE